MFKLDELKSQINHVRNSRAGRERTERDYQLAMDAWIKENATLVEERSRAREQLEFEEERLRQLTLNYYQEDESKSKTPSPGVGIRLMIRLTYDKETAFQWASDHSVALRLNTKAFEKAVKAGIVPSTVAQIHEEPISTISQILPEE
jgi:hypothetical protein